MIECSTETPEQFPQLLRVREHEFRADVSDALGSRDSAPGPHDYFDAALAACKTLTATWYAKQKNIPLERVECRIERDDSKERQGVYLLRVHLTFHGPLDEAQKKRLYDAVARCPVHKLMTTAEIQIETAPLD